MIGTHSQHPTDEKIPQSIRPFFLDPDDLRWGDRRDSITRLCRDIEELLAMLVNLVVHEDINWNGDPAVLEPGRGPQLGHRRAEEIPDRANRIVYFASRDTELLSPMIPAARQAFIRA